MLSVLDQFGSVIRERGREFRESDEGRKLKAGLDGLYRNLEDRERATLQVVLSSLDGAAGHDRGPRHEPRRRPSHNGHGERRGATATEARPRGRSAMASMSLRIRLGPLVYFEVDGDSCAELTMALDGFEELNEKVDAMCSDLARRVYPGDRSDGRRGRALAAGGEGREVHVARDDRRFAEVRGASPGRPDRHRLWSRGLAAARIGPIRHAVGQVPIALAVPVPRRASRVGEIGPFDLGLEPLDLALEALELRCEGLVGPEGLSVGLDGGIACKLQIDVEGTLPGRVRRAPLEFDEDAELEREERE